METKQIIEFLEKYQKDIEGIKIKNQFEYGVLFAVKDVLKSIKATKKQAL